MLSSSYPDIIDVLRDLGVGERTLKRLSARRRIKRADRPRCNARRRDGQQCQAHAVLDERTWKPSHGGRCRLHGGLSTGPRTPEGKAAIAESNRRRAQLCAGVAAAAEKLEAALEVAEASLKTTHPMPYPDPMPRRGTAAA